MNTIHNMDHKYALTEIYTIFKHKLKIIFPKKILFVKKFRLCKHEHEWCCRICRWLMTSLWAYISKGIWLVAWFISPSITSPIIQNFWWVKWTFHKILNFFLHTSYNFYSYVFITTAVRKISVATHFHYNLEAKYKNKVPSTELDGTEQLSKL
jgi:hypothetical protein